MRSPLSAARVRRALATRRRRVVAASVRGPPGGRRGVGGPAGAARLPDRVGDGDRPLRTGRRRAGRPGHHALPAGRRLAPTGRCRRCCWRTASAAPRSPSRSDAEDLAERGYAVLDLDRPGLRPQRRRDPPGQPRLRGARRATPARLARRPARHPDRRRRRPAGRRGRRLVRRRPGPAARRPGPAGRRDRPDDHLERPVPRLPAGVHREGPDRGCVQEGLGRHLLRRRRPGLRTGRHLRRHRGSRRVPRRRPRPSPQPGGARAPSGRPGRRRRPGLRPLRRGRLRRVPADRHHRPGRRRRRSTLLRRSSPAGVLDRIKAPTLLVQGEADTLFPLGRGRRQRPRHRRHRHPGPGRLVHRRPRRRRGPRSPTPTG